MTTSPLVTFRVYGIPAPQGSKRAFVANGRARMKEAGGDAHARWRNNVADAAAFQRQLLDAPLDGPLHFAVVFRFPMPATRPAPIRARGWGWKTTAPDVDKLVRALGDGLQAGGLITDDARLVVVHATKAEVRDDWTGAEVALHPAHDVFVAVAP